MNTLGKGFVDQLSSRKAVAISSKGIDEGVRGRISEARVIPYFIMLVVGIGILIVRLFWVAAVKGSYYREISEENRIREDIYWAARGIIYDRNGEALVLNKPIYRARGEDGTYTYYNQEEAIALEVKGKEGDLELFIGREYPFGEIFAHLLGYIGEANKADVENGLVLGSLVGKGGIEERFDNILRGKEGKRLVETNALGEVVKQLGEYGSKPGIDVYTTIDSGLQKIAAESMKTEEFESRMGAVIASRLNGDILALYSSPSFDPNILIGGLGGQRDLGASKILEEDGRPLFNRAIGGLYPPGSTFKMITSIAALEEDIVDSGWTYNDKGVIKEGIYKYRNWYFTEYGRTEGETNFVKAIARSVDTFFYELGGKTGIDNIANWGRKFGLGRRSGIEISGEVEGRMPGKSWKLENKGERWYLGDTYHAAIGQGDILVTPLQVNMFTGALANGGKLCMPRIIITDGEGSNIENCKDLGIQRGNLDLILDGMVVACKPGGTGFPLFNFAVDDEGWVPVGATGSARFKKARKIAVACKTGTAQFGHKELTHAWFTAFAPVEDPEIVVTALLEKGGSGAYDAAPVVREILGEYFKK